MAGGFKIADAYVEISAQSDKAEAEAKSAAASMRSVLGDVKATISADTSDASSKAKKLEGDFEDAGTKSGEAFASKLGTAIGTGVAAVGATAGGLLAKGFSDNMGIEVANDKLAAQLGLTSAEAEKAGKVAGNVYRQNWGGSIEEVNAAIQSVGSSMADVGATTQADLEAMASKALALAGTFDVDVNRSTEAAGALIKNGLAKDSAEAFDILTAGFQNGTNKADDFTETLTEYSPQFAKLGISGQQAMGILSAGLKAGARDTDVIADAFKEFSLRSIDGSKLTAEGFKAAGLDATYMAGEIAKGGPAAEAATQQTLQGLLSIKDPVAQNAAGVALFGTQWEDTVRQILPALSGMGSGMEDVTGSTEKMMDTVGDNAQGKIDTAKRAFEGWTQSMASSDGALGLVATSVLSFGGPALAMGGSIGQLVTGMAAMNAGAALGVVKTGALAVAHGVAATASGVWTAAQWLLNAAMSANPIGIVIVVIAALVAAIIIAYKNSETFRNIVQAAMKGVVQAWGWVWEKARAVFSWLGGAYQSVKGFITNPVSSAVKSVVGFFGDVITRVKQIPGQITGAFSSAGSLLAGIGRKIIDGLIGGIQDKFNALRSKLGEVTNLIPSWKGPEDKDKNLLRPAGRLIMGGLQQGIDESLPSLQAQLGGITANIAATPVTQVAASSGGGGIVGGEYHFHFPPGTLDMLSDADRLRAVRQMRDELVKLEGGTR